MKRRLMTVAVMAACACMTAAPAHAQASRAAPTQSSRAARAEQLARQAEAHIARNSIDSRRIALRELEQATLLAPGNPDYQLALARAYYQAGFLKSSRIRFERVTRMAPENAEGRYGLGQAWRRDWLKYLDPTSLGRAISNLSWAARLDPSACDAWLLLAPLLIEAHDDRAAAAAAQRAFEADPQRPEAMLATAYTRYRLGDLAYADTAFASAIPRLKRGPRMRFEDISPVASEQDTMRLHRLTPEGQAEFVRRFWKDADPDLATVENEALLEYWSRVAHAFFLYYNPRRREWDERGEVYVRYGAPASAIYNPVGARLFTTSGATSAGESVVHTEFPANVLVWQYPELGMEVTMQDRLLSEYYMLPITSDFDPDPLPNPDSLARRDALLMNSGRGVFHTLPPGITPIPIDGVVARFEGEHGPRLMAQLEVPGTPGDSLTAEWVVLDSTRHEVTRSARPVAPSACDPAGRRVADFAAELPPGAYTVGLTVRDGHGGRGVLRGDAELVPPPASLAVSDLVLACGPPDVSGVDAPVLRIDPNPSARVIGSNPVTAYFEIYHLKGGDDGQGHFEFVYTVRSADRDKRIWIQRALQPRAQVPPISTSREEANIGPLRRQFVTVPIQSLPPGHYRLEVQVKDLVANVTAQSSVEFFKVAAMVPAGN